jgi:miniconductance mechanosensitive channel
MEFNLLKEWLSFLGLSNESEAMLVAAIAFIVVLILSWAAYIISHKVILSLIRRLADKTHTTWDDILMDKKVFRRLMHLVPAIVIHYGVTFALQGFPVAIQIIQAATYLYMVMAGLLVIDAVLNGFHEIYNTLDVSRNRSIKGYVQVAKIFIYMVGFGVVVSILLQKDLTTFFAGLGAMAAVIMLIFKDTILGLVAGIQLSANDMVRLGDWIEMPSRNADGDVIDISLNTVKVQNWDRTISTIPTYALVTESFSNWRGMVESGGRRIKRSVNIDVKSIHFLDKAEIEKFKKIQVIREYIENREREVERYNKEHHVDESMPVNGRRLTNIGTFRKYVEEYLRLHPKIHKDMTFLVRHLAPTDKGLPLEIYVFSNDQRWPYYEAIQADIFDHILAVIPQFGLRVYQNPTGDDIARLAEVIHSE